MEDVELKAPVPAYAELVERSPTADAAVAAVAPGVVKPPPPAASWKLTAGIVTAGLSVLGFGAWSYFGTVVSSKEEEALGLVDDVRTGKTTAAKAFEDRQTLDSQGQDAELRGWVGLGAGAALLATGGGLLLWEMLGSPAEPTPAAETSVAVGVTVVPLRDDGVGVSLTLY